ncbi:hypothetical protein AU512_05260 [Lonsdalea iberica]|uniref:Oligopeptide/dipeptide ABC transporter C-terminal domain-containing protein n=1 Tax=Lonsdalea iberica TaxID=1082703 RepID=A0ABX3XHL7_9GAMM|nr:oligopeptide/dipeptide ABC transporter ATP-binding protein [Lonsdalea iberica]OSN11055.1 hypothetical protein AU512_05260 [Lonsdalea iberica]
MLLGARSQGGLGKGSRLVSISGAPPDLVNLPAGCAFAPRCPQASELCRQRVPVESQVATEHEVFYYHWRPVERILFDSA